jgi:ABC-2 type transport system permease protein
MVIAPLFSAFFFLSLMQEGLPEELPVAIVDLDNSSMSRRVSRQLDAFKQTEITMRCKSFTEARKAMQKGEVYGIFYIPRSFEKEVMANRQPTISFYTNNSFLIAGSLLFRDMKTISVLGNAAVGQQFLLAKGSTEEQSMISLQPIAIDSHLLGNPWTNYSVYLNNILLPGILNILVMIMTVFALGTELKRGTSCTWLQIAHGDIFLALFAKLLPHTIIYFVVVTCIDVILYGFLGFPCQGGLFAMLTGSYLMVLAAMAMAVFFFGLLPIMRLSLSLASLWGVLSFSICGFTYPVSAMYPVFHSWSYLFPLRHYFLLYVDQGLNGIGWAYSWHHYLALLLFLFLPFFVMPRLNKIYRTFEYIP